MNCHAMKRHGGNLNAYYELKKANLDFRISQNCKLTKNVHCIDFTEQIRMSFLKNLSLIMTLLL